MACSNRSFLCGWRLFWAVALVVVACALTAFALQPEATEGSRAAIRVTARTSFLLFLATFTASSLAILMPGPMTRFLLRERRMVGLSFAFSHFVHAIAITAFGVLNPGFWPARSTLVNLPGTLGYVAILALAITSHRGIARRMGTTAWRRLHLTGMWIIAAVFTETYIRLVPSSVWYTVPSALLLAAFAVRMTASRAQSLKRSRHARPAA